MNNKNIDSLTSEKYADKKIFTCDICQRLFFTKIHYQLHSVIHLLPKHFNCHECQKGFTQILSLDKHIETHNNAMGIICHVCKEEFFDVDSLNEHTKKHSNQSTNALFVEQETGNEKILITINNNGKDSCHSENSEKHTLEKHVSNDRLKIFFRCDTCEKEFSEKHHLEEHLQKHCIKIQLNKYEELEPVSFTVVDHFHVSDGDDEPLVSDALYVNKNDILSENPQICENVKSFTAKSEESQNKSTNLCSQNPQTIENFICKVCKKEFENKHSLTIHLSTHSEEETFDCHLCEKKFSFKSLLNAHLRAHRIIGNKGIQKGNQEIKKSSNAFIVQQITNEDTQTKIINSGKHNSCHSERSVLGKHVSNEKLQNVFKCDTCKKEFSKKHHLDEHHQKHCITIQLNSHKHEEVEPVSFTIVDHFHVSDDNDEPLVSDALYVNKKDILSENPQICKNLKSFTEKSEESQNKSTNLCSQNPQTINFICELCKKVFENKHSLTVHFSTHSGEETFDCHLCEKKFSFKSLLNAHLRAHEIKKFSCISTNPIIVKQITHNEDTLTKIINSRKHNSCQSESGEEYVLGKLVSNDKLKNIFKCDKCNKEFPEKHQLNGHHQNHCIQDQLDSDKCEDLVPVTFTSVNNFPVSNDNHDKNLVCNVLDLAEKVISSENSQIYESVNSFIRKSKEKQNKIENTNLCSQNPQTVEKFICEVCKKVFKNKHSLTIHLSTHSEEKIFCCHLCEKKFSFKSLLNAHLRTHDANKFSCGVCQKSFSSKNKLFNHVHIHAIVKSFRCNACHMTFPEKSLLEEHRLHSHSSKECDICHKKLSSRAKMLVHRRIHSGSRPYVCKICSKSYTIWTNLNRHKRIHTGEKPFQCETCGACFTQKVCLTKHRMVHEQTCPQKQPCNQCPEGYMLKSSGNSRLCIHLEKKPFKCDICEKKFTTRHCLKNHQYTHSGNTPYVCEICNKGFIQKANVILHHRSHTGEKPFLCETCGKKFRTKTGLQIHPCTLQNQAPFKCEVCQKGFAFKSPLDVHARIHRGEKPFVCDLCDRKFTQKIHLKRHLRLMHGKDSTSVM